MMRLLRQQQHRVDRALLAPTPWLYGIWGTAWLAGFGLLSSTFDGGNPLFRVPGVVAGTGFAVLIIGASSELISVYFPSAFGLMAGTLYLAGAALWRDKTQLVLGLVVLAVSSAAPFAGQPANNLVMAIGGGGAFLVAAAVAAVALNRSR